MPLTPAEQRRLSAKKRAKALEVIAKNKRNTGTAQSFGTGAGAARGPNKISHKVREAIHAADAALRDKQAMAEVVRNLAAMGIVTPDLFKGVKRNAPRIGTMTRKLPFTNGRDPPQVELIRNQPEPSLEEIAMYAKLPIDSMRRLKRMKGSSMYAHLREQFIRSRMSPGERRVANAIQHQNVCDSYERMTGQPASTARKLRRDAGVPRTMKHVGPASPSSEVSRILQNDPDLAETLRNILAPQGPRIVKG